MHDLVNQGSQPLRWRVTQGALVQGDIDRLVVLVPAQPRKQPGQRQVYLIGDIVHQVAHRRRVYGAPGERARQ